MLLALGLNLLIADSITSFAVVDESKVKKGETVDLAIGYIATKKHKLKLKAYDEDTNNEISPTFSATDVNHVSYDIPSDAESSIKLYLGLVEDDQVVDFKDVLLELNTMAKGLYFCDNQSYQSNVDFHDTFTNCFRPEDGVVYDIGYGDDVGAAIILLDDNKAFAKNEECYNSKANILALSDANIQAQHIDLTSSSQKTTVGGGGCCSRASAYASNYSISNLSYMFNYNTDTENRISARYNKTSNSVTIYFRGGNYSCSCSKNNCCGEGRITTYTVNIINDSNCNY